MVWRMKSAGQLKAASLGVALTMALAAGQVSADKVNPYMEITNRNAFGLGDPPPPPPPPTKPEPPKPVSTVRLSGITTMFSKARALFEIVEAPGKPMQKPIMLVGDKVGDIELLAIDVEDKTVTIRQSDVVTNLVLEARKSPAPPAPGQRPGLAPGLRPGFPPPGVKVPSQQTAAAAPGGSPMVIAPGSSGTSSGRSGVITVGGNSSTTPTGPTAPGSPGALGMPTAAAAAAFSAAGGRTPYRVSPGAVTAPGAAAAFATPTPNAANLRMTPTREIRAQATGPSDNTAERQLLMMHLNSMADPDNSPPPPPIPGE
jgi:hypothetical protein